MSCTSPLYRIPETSGNFRLLIRSDRNRLKNGGVFLGYSELESYSRLSLWNSDEVQKLRCGQCMDCRLAYSRDWAVRCSLEASMHEHNYFVTLTYDDNTLPRGEYIDYNGDIFDSQLVRRDVQLFIKNLREWERVQHGNTGIKVFYCGEYGGQTSRPHYHICLFGVSEIPDLKFFAKRGNYKFYKSSLYEQFWSIKQPGMPDVLRGFVDISDVTFDSIAYTARYITKKQKGLMKKNFLEFWESLYPASRWTLELRKQPFVGMSLKPGIASEYYEKHKLQIRSEDLVKYQKKYDIYKSRPPRYFDKLFDRDDPEGFAELKAKRCKAGIAAQKVRYRLCSESEISRMRHEEEILQRKVNRYYVRGL